MRQWTTDSEDPDNMTLLRSHGSENALVEEQHEVITDRGIDSLRKRNNLHDSPSSVKANIIKAAPHSAGLLIQVPGSPSKSSHFDHSDVHNSSNKIGVASRGAGLSRATVFLLLSSHLLRMLYFYGVKLENERITSGDGVSPSTPSITATIPMQWDLFGQSASMIIMQLLLLHAMTNVRRIRRRTGSNSDYPSPPRHLSHDNDITQSVWKSLYAITTAHFRRLLSPSNILQNHSFLEYVELLFLSSIATKLMFDYQWFPRYRMRVVDTLKHTSIVLESCLAVPQAMRNYSKGTTEGLNAIMVGGWVLGDFLKLFYFSFQLLWLRVTGVGDAGGNIVFVIGCVFALAMDFLICFQMAFWYQSRETLELKESIIRSIQKLKASHRSNESLPCKLLRRKDGRPSSS